MRAPRPAPERIRQRLDELAKSAGFQQIGVARAPPELACGRFARWLELGMHGEMGYMARHGRKRLVPAELVPGTVSVLCVRMDYWPEDPAASWAQLRQPNGAYVSRYAVGRDYHKLLRRRLLALARALAAEIGPFGHRVFVDSAPVLEKPLAEAAGLGWIGKNGNLIHARAGSLFFLGEIYSDLDLPGDQPATGHCGRCTRCLPACPTGAIVAPHVVDARRCISYLTIELPGAIPEALRPQIGNRIYGCDDCQLVCPWNKFARLSGEADFRARHGLDQASLLELFAWTEADFLSRTEGSAIRRLGYLRWLRNLAVALGNAPPAAAVVAALAARADHPSELVREHVAWALARQHARMAAEPYSPEHDFRATERPASG